RGPRLRPTVDSRGDEPGWNLVVRIGVQGQGRGGAKRRAGRWTVFGEDVGEVRFVALVALDRPGRRGAARFVVGSRDVEEDLLPRTLREISRRSYGSQRHAARERVGVEREPAQRR